MLTYACSLTCRQLVVVQRTCDLQYLLALQESTDNVLDEVMSYTGMRKISLGKVRTGEDHPLRIFLNNEPFLGFGPLDQVC